MCARARARAATLRVNVSLRDDVVGAGVAPIDSSVRAATLSAAGGRDTALNAVIGLKPKRPERVLRFI